MKPSLSSLLLGLLVAFSLTAPASARVQHRKPVAKTATPAAATAQRGAKGLARKAGGKVVGGKGLRRAVLAGAAVGAGAVAAEPLRASFGQMQGLHANSDPLELKSSVALVVDQDTNEVLFSKNPSAVLPIASITKLMTALVVVEAHQSLDEVLTITQDDIDTEKGSRSRLAPGTQLTRREMLHLALMSSENRAANALGRNYPGGLAAAVAAMNKRALSLGMHDTHYVEPTGLSSHNQSSAQDLAKLVKEAHNVPLLREFSTSQEAQVAVGKRVMQFHTTNGLVRSPHWDIGLQKTGYIAEAGRCLVMQAQLAGRKLIMVLLDSTGKYSRIGDAERIRRWLDHATAQMGAVPRRTS